MNVFETRTKITVIGVGGAGGNIISTFAQEQLPGIKVHILNTDGQDLESRPNNNINKLQIGPQITKGSGAGSDPEVGKKAFKESKDTIETLVEDSDIVFTVFGLGGGTGTGAGPEVAKLAMEKGALSIVLATLPFSFEGKRKETIAKDVGKKLNSFCDSYTLFSNQKLMAQAETESMENAYHKIDDQVRKSISTISNLALSSGKINIDFADIKTLLKKSGQTIIATGSGSGPSPAYDAVVDATENELFEGTISGCRKAIVNIMASRKAPLSIQNKVVEQLKTLSVAEDIDITAGLTFVEDAEDEINVAIIATAFEQDINLDDTYEEAIITNKIEKETIKTEEFDSLLIEDEDLEFIEESTLETNVDNPTKDNSSNDIEEKRESISDLFDESYGGDIYDDTSVLTEEVPELNEDEDIFEFEE